MTAITDQLPISYELAEHVATSALDLYRECRDVYGLDRQEARNDSIRTVAEGASTPADPAADPTPDAHPATAATRVRAFVETYRRHMHTSGAAMFTEPITSVSTPGRSAVPLYLRDLVALLDDRTPPATARKLGQR